jgi:quercetin dioxygenase-like cupin family protein
MDTTSFQTFGHEAASRGFDVVLERRYAAHAAIDTHTHDFDVEAVVREGEMWLTCDGHTRHLRALDTFTLARHTPHAERYGADGAMFWVARRTAAA